MAREAVVRLKDVVKRYVDDADAQAALDGVSLTIDSGEFVAVMGQSGSGKTTLLNLVGGLDREFLGSVEVLGQELSKLGDRQLSELRNRSIGFVFQSYHLLPQLSCAENVALPAMFRKEPLSKLDERVDEVLAKVGLVERKAEPPTKLSGGQKQRVAIARALLLKPDLLLCDEPTGNLDQRTGEELILALRELSKEEGLTVVIVTHENQVADSCDRIIRLRDGRVVKPGEEEPS